jgi:uncharacterized DUF497 family protein
MNAESHRVEWDDANADANYRKHGVDFAIAVERHDPFSGDCGEDRFIVGGSGTGNS